MREALNLAFDFEWSNKNLFFGLYTRTASYCENSDMKAEGPPSPEELALLEPFRDKLLRRYSGLLFQPPVPTAAATSARNCARRSKLLPEAGWTHNAFFEGWKNAKGETLTVEILLDSLSFERIVGPYLRTSRRSASMPRCGEWMRRSMSGGMKDFDFDLTT